MPSLANGLPMIGHAVWVPETMTRPRASIETIPKLIERARVNNHRMIEQARPTVDIDLDEGVWAKTQAEIDGELPKWFQTSNTAGTPNRDCGSASHLGTAR